MKYFRYIFYLFYGIEVQSMSSNQESTVEDFIKQMLFYFLEVGNQIFFPLKVLEISYNYCCRNKVVVLRFLKVSRQSSQPLLLDKNLKHEFFYKIQ